MAFIGYHASHEQLAPSALLHHVIEAEEAGFDGAMCSDHLAPWSVREGESGFAWSWLGAALAATSFSLGVVTAPGQRCHPVLVAQAIATLEEMFPGRFWAALGSGEALNEHITGDPWPDKAARERRLQASAEIITQLLAGREVSAADPVRTHRARVWSRPHAPPPLLGAAVTARTAAWLAGRFEGIATVGRHADSLREVVSAYRDAGGTGPAVLQLHIALADTDAEGLAIARDQWAHATIEPPQRWDIEQPEDFDALTADVTDDQLRDALLIDTDPRRLAARIAELVATGFDRVYLHDVGLDPRRFIAAARDALLPALRGELGDDERSGA